MLEGALMIALCGWPVWIGLGLAWTVAAIYEHKKETASAGTETESQRRTHHYGYYTTSKGACQGGKRFHVD